MSFVLTYSLTFCLVECPKFRVLLLYLTDDVETRLPDLNETVKKWII